MRRGCVGARRSARRTIVGPRRTPTIRVVSRQGAALRMPCAHRAMWAQARATTTSITGLCGAMLAGLRTDDQRVVRGRQAPQPSRGEADGMRCPYCTGSSHVVDTREVTEAIRRRRECDACRQRFTTYERVSAANLQVVKADGRREDFSRDKLMRGLRLACAKRPVSADAIEAIAGDIEGQLYRLGRSEVPSEVDRRAGHGAAACAGRRGLRALRQRLPPLHRSRGAGRRDRAPPGRRSYASRSGRAS